MKITKQIDVLGSLGLPPLPSQSPDTIAALMWAREVLQKHQTRSYAVQDPNGIEELKAVKIGGVDQWLHIRGRNRNNPVLLYLHGGPGGAMIGSMDAVQRPWEDYFTIVHWDQRQTGKSYYPADDENTPLTIDQFVSDTEEVIQYLRSNLNQEKIVLLGHSWGTVLGMHMVQRHPEWLHAYIAIGQVVSLIEGERLIYRRLLELAKEQSNDEIIAHLESIAPYPAPDCPAESFVDNAVYLRTELSRFAGETLMHHTFFEDVLKIWSFGNTISPHLTLTDLSNGVLGDVQGLWRDLSFTRQFMDINLPRDVGSSFEIPVFFFTGAHDGQTPVTLSDQWFSEIKAPHKELIHFQESAHDVKSEEPGKFLVALVNKVLPFAQLKSDQ